MMPAPDYRFIQTNGITLRAVVQGEGPLVVLVHGFPESWHAWRHQIPAIAAAGFRVCAIDVRGYGGSDKPHPVEAYEIETITADLAGLIDTENGGNPAILIGHDWGAAIVWHTALVRAAHVHAVAALSVPWLGIGETAFVDLARKMFTERGWFFYQVYFQEPGVAESELEADLEGFIRKFYYWLSGEAAGQRIGVRKPAHARLLDDLIDPERFPAWMSDSDIAFLVSEFRQSGLRGPINRYRNQQRDLAFLQPWRGKPITQPALFIGGTEDAVLKFNPGIDPMERMQHEVPNLMGAHLLEGCGHWTQQERPDAVNQLLLAWLEKVRP